MRKLFTESQRLGLIEATYPVDAAARAEANKVWDKVIAYIEAEAKDDPPYHYMTKHDSTQGFAITRYDVPALPGDLGVILAPPHGNVHGQLAQSIRNQDVIIIYGALQHPHHTEHLDIRIKGPTYRATFVHEYVHYLDARRNPMLRKQGDSGAKAHAAGERERYLQSPVEYNAWFQAASHEIEAALDREEANIHLYGKKAPKFRKYGHAMLGHLKDGFKTFPAFLAWAESKTVGVDIEDVLTHIRGTKWERKWKKRMYTLYRALKPRVAEMRVEG